jgi:hypothetical protein
VLAIVQFWTWAWKVFALLRVPPESVHNNVRDEQGEGVISAAIAVLIMAFLGVALWVAFKATLGSATATVSSQVNQIGN